MGRYIEYQVIGRKLPTAAEETPKLYRMRIFAPNEVCFLVPLLSHPELI
jgi:large subunit ribosomal protein L18Ae